MKYYSSCGNQYLPSVISNKFIVEVESRAAGKVYIYKKPFFFNIFSFRKNRRHSSKELSAIDFDVWEKLFPEWKTDSFEDLVSNKEFNKRIKKILKLKCFN